MAESSLEVTAGSGTKLQTSSRMQAAATVEAQHVLLGQDGRATYTAIAQNVSIAVSLDHVLQLMGDGTNYCELVEVHIYQSDTATAVGTADIRIYRISTAGTGGGTVSARPMDAGDTDPYGGGCMTLPTVKGSEGNLLRSFHLGVVAAEPLNALNSVHWTGPEGTKGPRWGTATSDGLAFKIVSGLASTSVTIEATFRRTSYLA